MLKAVYLKKYLSIFFLMILFVFVEYDCHADMVNSSTFNGGVNQPIIRIGTLPFNPPFETGNVGNGVFVGFEIDVMNSICQRMSANCVFKAIPGYQLIFEALDQGQIDATVASIVIIEGSDVHIFSYPFLPSYVQFFAKKNTMIQKTAQIAGKKIGMINDPLLQAVMMQRFGTSPPFVIFPTVQAGIDSLTQGNIDVMVMEAMSVDYWISNTGGIFKKVGDPIPFGLGYGVMSTKNNLDLINRINNAITMIENDGTYTRIYNRYFGM